MKKITILYTFLLIAFALSFSESYAQGIFNASIHTAVPFGSVNSPANEGPQNVIDQNFNTKFLDFNAFDGIGFQVNLLGVPHVAAYIEIVTANDAPERDPTAYEVFGSNDGVNFTSIATGNIPCTPDRFRSRTFSFANTQSFTHYRVNFTGTCATSSINQIADVQLYAAGTQPSCVELGTTVGQMSSILKTVGGVCGPAAVSNGICDCPSGYVVVGYEGFEGNSWGPMVISQFSLRCRELNSDGTLGTTISVTCANGNVAGTTPDGPIDAPADQAIVGLELRIGCAIDAVIGKSKPISEIIAGLPNASSNGMTAIGGGGGSPAPVMYAPFGNVIIGMETFLDPSTNLSGGVAWRYAPIIACPLMCSLDGVSVSNISACGDNGTNNDPSDDTYTADVTVTFTDAPATGTLDISGDGTASVAVGSLGMGTYTFTGITMSADGGAIDLTATFSADPACTLNNPNAGTAPAPCSAMAFCSISNIVSSNISVCNNNGTPGVISDDIFTADVTVTFSNAPATGTLNLTGDATASVAVGSIGATSYTFTGLTMSANGTPIALTASFSADAGCILSNSNTSQAPNQCSITAPPGSIPTMSEWGLILFALIIFTFSVVMGTQQQQKLAIGGNMSTSVRQTLPFDKNRFFKILPIVYLGFATVFASAVALFGYEMTSADIPGSLLSGIVIAYLIQFVFGSKSNK